VFHYVGGRLEGTGRMVELIYTIVSGIWRKEGNSIYPLIGRVNNGTKQFQTITLDRLQGP
jgi:hypothetical protein